MSTKTSIKRIAAVAAVALTLGGFSAVSAHADTTPTFGAPSGTVSDSGTAGTAPTSKATVGTYIIDTVTAGSADHVYTITTSGVGSVNIATAPSTKITADNTAGIKTIGGLSSTGTSYSVNGNTITWFADAAAGLSVFTGGNTVIRFSATSSTAGDQTITVKGDVSGAITHIVTWGAAPVSSASASTVVASGLTKASTNALATSTSDIDLSAPATAYADQTYQSASGGLYIVNKDNTSGAAVVTSDKLRVRIVSGPALLQVAYGSSARSASDAAQTLAFTTDSTAASANGYAAALVYSTGTAGTAVVEVSDATTGTVLGSKTFTFYGTSPAKLAITQNSFVAPVGHLLGHPSAVAGSGAFTVAATDSNGFPVKGLDSFLSGSTTAKGFYLTSSNTDCISTTITHAVAGDGAASTHNAVGTYEFDVVGAANAVAGCTSDVALNYNKSASAPSIVSTDKITIAVGSSKISAITMTTDKDSYLPGEKVTVSLTAKDSTGLPVADNVYSTDVDATNGNIGGYGVWQAAAAHAAFAGLTSSAQLTTYPFAFDATASVAGDADVTFTKGVATATFYAPYYSGTFIIKHALATSNGSFGTLATALLGTTLSANVTVTAPGDAASQAAIDAAQEATDAANAAYDAANNAMDSADAATAAAQDASDNASAALAAVTSLSATVAKLVKSVAAIAAALAKVQKKIGA